METACNRLENNLRVKEAEASNVLNLVLIEMSTFPNIIIIIIVGQQQTRDYCTNFFYF